MLRVAFLFRILSSIFGKQGSGWDPSGFTSPPPEQDQGSGLDPLG